MNSNKRFGRFGFFAALSAALGAAFATAPISRAGHSSGGKWGETSTKNRGGQMVKRKRGSRKTVCAHPIKNFQGGIAARMARHAE